MELMSPQKKENNEKIKVSELDIIVNDKNEKHYYEIKYFDIKDNEYHIGYSSYDLNNVINWKNECFEIVDNHSNIVKISEELNLKIECTENDKDPGEIKISLINKGNNYRFLSYNPFDNQKFHKDNGKIISLYYNKNKLNFYKWIIKNYINEDNSIGDLAREIMIDEKFPKYSKKEKYIRNHLEDLDVCGKCLETFDRAYSLYKEYFNE